MDLLYLCVAALTAGFVDAIAGGGGLIQLPALFVFLPPTLQASPAAILGTNKVSSICGTGMAVAQYTRSVPIAWRAILPTALVAFGCSCLGAIVVTLIQPRLLKPMVLVLLGLVAVYTFLHKEFGSRHRPKFTPRQVRWLGVLVGMAVGFYDGFFGPGTGTLLILAFVGLGGFDFLTASASAKAINLATNLSAVIYFIATDNILYAYGLPMALCNVLGAWLGSRLAILKGNRFIRRLFLGIVTAMIARFAWEVVHP